MKLLALERDIPDIDSAQFTTALLESEALHVWELHQSGVIRELYFRADAHLAVLVLECADVIEAEAVLARLPLVAAGLIAFDVIPLTAYPGFARLFR